MGRHVLTGSTQNPAEISSDLMRDAALPRLRIIRAEKDEYDIGLDRHPNYGFEDLMRVLGTADRNFIRGLLSQIIDASAPGRHLDENSLNFTVSVIKEAKPKDQMAAMLLAQMSAVHMVTMNFARRLGNAQNPVQLESAGRAFNRLARTYVTQMDVLKRYQMDDGKITVQNVSVSEGSQAIVGNVTQNARADTEAKTADAISPAALPATHPTPMPIIEKGNQRIRIPVKRRSS